MRSPPHQLDVGSPRNAYDEAPQLCQAWLQHADALTVVGPFGVPAAQLADTIEAIRCR